VNLTEMFPDDNVSVAAAKVRVLARTGQIVLDRPNLTVCRDVAKKYVEARGGGKHYYLAPLLDAVGDKPMDQVTTADIKEPVEQWKKRKRALAGAKRGLVAERHLKQTARHFFNWAIREGYATRTPFRSIDGVPLIPIKASKGRTRRLEDGEEARLLDAAKSDDLIRDVFTALVETSCRPGELRTLQWSEVRKDEIVLLASKTKDREERRVPIMPVLAAILDRRRLAPDGTKLSSESFVFGDDTGRQISRERLNTRWRAVCKSAGVKDLHLHDLRAEAASQLSESGATTEQVRDALGHSSITMTNNYLRSRARGLHKVYRQRAARRAREGMRRVK
jgi:integrase